MCTCNLNKIMTYIVAGTPIPQPHAVEGTAEVVSRPGDILTKRPHFYTLYRTLHTSAAHRWRVIGLFLKLDQGKLDVIELETHKASICLEKVLSLWFTGIDPPPTKSAIINVLKELELNEEAEKLQLELVLED